ncbi:MAG TPA: carboxypeptidase regulatory-like domain-containing protein, partial [Bryobacteraceae bacterium]|nr:carboxypeptidase regulatory-like domain-containing protein [Bryobacteraceae bacterium]
AYTWSKDLTDASAYNSTGDAIEGLDRHFNYGPASHDRRHIFVGTYTYRIPLLRDRRGIVGTAFGRWEISGITRFQSGALLTPTGSSFIPGTRRSSYIGGPVALPSDQRGPDLWFNTAAFTNAPPAALGNAGVGIIQAPGWENWDVSLRKNFRVREGWNLGFTADAFNVMNHVNFDDPNVSTSNSAFGTISTSQPARNIQFGLRFSF